MEDRRFRYQPKNNQNQSDLTQENIKIDLMFDVTELDLFASYVVSENRKVGRSGITNIKRLLEIMNLEPYASNPVMVKKLEFIARGVTARLRKNLQNRDLLIRDISGGLGSNNVPDIRELSNNEIDWVNDNVTQILKYSHFQSEADEGIELLTLLKSSNWSNRKDVVDRLDVWMTRLMNKNRRAKIENMEDITFCLANKDVMLNALTTSYRHETDMGNALRLGIQALNLLFGGGLYAARVYTLLGLPGEGKSSTMLDMALQVKHYNKEYKCKDPTKRPCILFFSMENSVIETVTRMFSMLTLKQMRDCTTEEEAIQLFAEKGLRISDEDPIDLIIKFRPNLSEDTSYLYKLIDDLEDEGYEVICVFQDYLKRIRSVEGSFGGDLRRQLGAVVNEFKVLATLKDIPVVTASQLNRDATANIDNARIKNKSDLVRILGRHNVGESNLILENSDWICLLAPEEINDGTGEKYLGMQRVKSRYYIDDSSVTVYYMPYILHNIKLIEDVYSPSPAHKETLQTNSELNGAVMLGQPNKVKSFVDFDDVSIEQEENNIFANASFAAKYFDESIPISARPVWTYNPDKDKRVKKQMYHLA